MRVPVTRNFDTMDVIGQLLLRSGIEIPFNSVFSLSYDVQEFKDGKPIKGQVRSISLIPDSNFLSYLGKQESDEITRLKEALTTIRTLAQGESSPGYPSLLSCIVEMVDRTIGEDAS